MATPNYNYYHMARGRSSSPSQPSPAAEYSALGGNPYAYNHNPYALSSQHSLVSDSDLRASRNADPDYAEDIPLKSHAQYATAPPPVWMQQPTRYPPSPMDQAGPDPIADSGRQRRRRRRRCDPRKIPWVTYILTIAQIAVFIVELVFSGKFGVNLSLERVPNT